MLQRSLSKKSTTDVTPSAPAQAPARGIASPAPRSSAQDRVGNAALAGRAGAPASTATAPVQSSQGLAPVQRGPTKRGPELAVGDDGKAPTTAAPGQESGVLRPESFRAGQKGALIGRGAQVRSEERR